MRVGKNNKRPEKGSKYRPIVYAHLHAVWSGSSILVAFSKIINIITSMGAMSTPGVVN